MSFAADGVIGGEISGELAPGERLLWSGRPRRGIALSGEDLFLVPFSLLWLGFAVYWSFLARRSGAPPFFTLWGLMFVLLGAYFVAGRFLVDAWQRGRTVYGLTDQRALIVSRSLLGNQEVKSLPLRTMPEIGLSTKSDGSGTITFGSLVAGPYPSWMTRFYAFGSRRNAPPAFEMIENARQVYEQLLQAERSEDQRR